MSDELKIDLTGIVEEDEGDGEDQEDAGDGSPGPLAGLLAPVAGIAAKLAGPLAPVLRVFTFVPLPILSAAGSALGVLLLVLIVTTVTGSGRATADAKEVADPHAAATQEDDHDAEPIIRVVARNAVPTSTPQPTPTSTPAVFQVDGGRVTAVGRPGGVDLGGLLPADNVYTFEHPIEHGLRMSFSVLVRSGSSSPVWGVLLAYLDSKNYSAVRFLTDDYDQNRPSVALVQVKDGKASTVGDGRPLGSLAYWGRETYEFRVAVAPQEIRFWLNGRTVARWPNPGLPPDARSGLYLLGPSRMRFESIVVE